ncbi:hypothetical protein KR100_01660 [Synechococcus sp. KORDI-100]|uniref:tetratricopeptide repeat-containing glycosyltransferase family protein n=1 Tax=Synechococcus sp. KORDI-100 TaxID=1280380 RepID=UPI0004E0567A|nr:tetratricopeptide repeat protein [Synechococcus sp. KORDI-100]AII42114.1 hypothetical protein KR100_01660 [Synechococcus sp. KORDI-100]
MNTETKDIENTIEIVDDLEDQGLWLEAIKILNRKCSQYLQQDELFHRLGRLHQRLGKFNQAEKNYRIALQINPNRSGTLNNLALISLAKQEDKDALRLLSRGLSIQNNTSIQNALLYSSLCETLLFIREPQKANLSAKYLIQYNPECNGYTNLAVCLRQQNKLHEARRSQELSILKGNPFKAIDRVNLIQSIGKPKSSIEASVHHHLELVNLGLYDLQINPDNNLSLCLLLANIGMHSNCWTDERFIQRTWNGRNIRLLTIWHDQGYGDTFQHLRWIDLACKKCEHLQLYLPSSLLNTIKQRFDLPSNCSVHTMTQDIQFAWMNGDQHLGLSNLQIVLANETKPRLCYGNYLKKPDFNKEKTGIGLVWSAGKHREAQPEWSARIRDVPLKKLIPIAAKWSKKYAQSLVSLQLCSDSDLHTWKDFINISQAELLEKDWMPTVRSIEKLRLIVTVDTAVAHLCGALGIECIVLLNSPCDWRWGQSGSKCRIYPTLHLARCQNPNDWDCALDTATNIIKRHYSF